MFYACPLNLKLFETSLLSSSSFVPIYSGDRKIPFAKFRREAISLTPLIAGLLAACGDSTKYVPVDDVDITGGDSPNDFTVTVMDGPIEGTLVYIDTNNNDELDASDIELGRTDASGTVHVDDQYAGEENTADLSGAFDLFTANYFDSGIYKATSDPRGVDLIISPVTYIFQELVSADPTLDTQAALDILFGPDSGIEYSDLNNPDNYMPASSPNTSQEIGHPISVLEAISQTSINLQLLLERFNFDIPTVIAALFDENGFSPASDLTPELVQEAASRLSEARERSGGEPTALSDTELTTDQDIDLSLQATVWGFRDPAGNSDNVDTQLTEVRIMSVVNGPVLVVGDGGSETVNPADSAISADEIGSVLFRPDASFSGTADITYRVFDGEAVSDIATLTVTVAAVPVNQTVTGTPLIVDPDTGNEPVIGETLTVDISDLTDTNGLPDSADDFSYQWVRTIGGTATNIATTKTYTLLDDDVGATITVSVSFTDDDGFSEGPLTSAATAAVIDKITGTASNDVLNGSANAELIEGLAGDDTFDGGEGNDTIDGGEGVNILTGGDGLDDDEFILRFHEIATGSGEYDIVTDYHDGDVLKTSSSTHRPAAVLFFQPDEQETAWGVRIFNIYVPMDTHIRYAHGHAADYKTDSSGNAASLTNSASNTNAMDTIVYHGNYTAEPSDDWVLAVLEDFSPTPVFNLY